MEELYLHFGLSVRKHRKAKGMSQEELAVLTEMGRPTIASIENGRQAVALHQAVKLAEALDVDAATLITGMTKKPLAPGLFNLHESLSARDFEILEQLHGELL